MLARAGSCLPVAGIRVALRPPNICESEPDLCPNLSCTSETSETVSLGWGTLAMTLTAVTSGDAEIAMLKFSGEGAALDLEVPGAPDTSVSDDVDLAKWENEAEGDAQHQEGENSGPENRWGCMSCAANITRKAGNTTTNLSLGVDSVSLSVSWSEDFDLADSATSVDFDLELQVTANAPGTGGGGDTQAAAAAGGGVFVTLWWLGKILAPLCGPGVLICAAAG